MIEWLIKLWKWNHIFGQSILRFYNERDLLPKEITQNVVILSHISWISSVQQLLFHRRITCKQQRNKGCCKTILYSLGRERTAPTSKSSQVLNITCVTCRGSAAHASGENRNWTRYLTCLLMRRETSGQFSDLPVLTNALDYLVVYFINCSKTVTILWPMKSWKQEKWLYTARLSQLSEQGGVVRVSFLFPLTKGKLLQIFSQFVVGLN